MAMPTSKVTLRLTTLAKSASGRLDTAQRRLLAGGLLAARAHAETQYEQDELAEVLVAMPEVPFDDAFAMVATDDILFALASRPDLDERQAAKVLKATSGLQRRRSAAARTRSLPLASALDRTGDVTTRLMLMSNVGLPSRWRAGVVVEVLNDRAVKFKDLQTTVGKMGTLHEDDAVAVLPQLEVTALLAMAMNARDAFVTERAVEAMAQVLIARIAELVAAERGQSISWNMQEVLERVGFRATRPTRQALADVLAEHPLPGTSHEKVLRTLRLDPSGDSPSWAAVLANDLTDVQSLDVLRDLVGQLGTDERAWHLLVTSSQHMTGSAQDVGRAIAAAVAD